MSATIIPFPAPDRTVDALDWVQANSNRWDRARDALAARDYDRFDRIMGKRAWDPMNQPGGDAA